MKKLISFLICLCLFTTTAYAQGLNSFSDVSPTDWYYESVMYLTNNNILQGTTDTTFSPNGTLTKGEAVVLITRTYITPVTEDWETALNSSWTYAVNAGLILEENMPFDSLDEPISRYEFAELLSSAMNLNGYISDPSLYALFDYGEEMPARFRNAVYNCYIAGLLSGVDSTGRFDGDRTLTRAEASVALHRLLVPETRTDFTGFKDYSKLLGTFSTTYDNSKENRSYNVVLSTDTLNNVIIPSGEEFSLNGIIGNAGKDNGYKLATIISGGKYTQGYGGGVCQTATTLYNAALLSNMKITERHPHALRSEYVAAGYDATISSGVLDLKFVNPYEHSIKIVGRAGNGTVMFSIYGYKDTEVPEVKLNVTKSNGVYTLVRTADGVENFRTSSKYKN